VPIRNLLFLRSEDIEKQTVKVVASKRLITLLGINCLTKNRKRIRKLAFLLVTPFQILLYKYTVKLRFVHLFKAQYRLVPVSRIQASNVFREVENALLKRFPNQEPSILYPNLFLYSLGVTPNSFFTYLVKNERLENSISSEISAMLNVLFSSKIIIRSLA